MTPVTPTLLLAAADAPDHPALRWRPLEGAELQHRRAGAQTACGLLGPLGLAESDWGRCPACYEESTA